MDDSFKEIMDEIPEEPYPEKEDEEVIKRAKEFEKLLADELEEYEKTEEAAFCQRILRRSRFCGP